VTPGVLAQVVACTAEHAHRLMPRQHELAVLHRHIELVTLPDAEGMTEVSREHHSSERVDASSAVRSAHANAVLPCDMRSVL
jgi:hypothetical protein